MARISMLLLTSVLALQQSYSQQASPVDVFPLSVGNRWAYRYSRVDSLPFAAPGRIIVDTGTASYRITGSIISVDSTRWTFAEQRNLRRSIHYFSPPQPDSFYVIQDSSAFEIIEQHQGQHWVYRNGPPYYYEDLGVFSFDRGFTDTTRVFRYMPTDSNGTITFLSQVPFGDVPFIFTFRQGIGLKSVYGRLLVLSGSVYCVHQLAGFVVTSTPEQLQTLSPFDPVLLQNYPNPFNPTTSIEYDLPRNGSVSLKLFDVMGREVMVLVESKQEAGLHRVTFNAENLSSGVYFYRLKSDDFVVTRKLLYLR